METVIRKVAGRKDLKQFIFLPERLHDGHAAWVPPIYSDEWQYFNPRKNPAFGYCDTTMLLALRNEKPVGRVLGIINHRANKMNAEKTVRFSCLETIEDSQVVRLLLHHIEQWALQKGMQQVVGPMGFTGLDPEGFQVEGFENKTTITSYGNFRWMPPLVEECGYSKIQDYVTYRLETPPTLPRAWLNLQRRILLRNNLTLVEAYTKKEIKPWIKSAFQLMNNAYTEAGIFGFVPLDDREIEMLIRRYLPVIDPRFVKGVLKNNELIAFIIALPDMTEGIRKSRGRLFPFGFYHILKARRKSRQLDLLLGAVRPDCRNLGADVLIMTALMISAQQAGIKEGDTHHQMENNQKMRAISERLGGEVYKRYRVYRKTL